MPILIASNANFRQNWLEFWRYHNFPLSRWRPSAILDFQNFIFAVTAMAGQICISIPNFIKIGQTVADISHLWFHKMAVICYLGFLMFAFFN